MQKYSLTLFGMTPKKYTDSTPVEDLKCMLCEKIVEYSKSSAERQLQLSLFDTSPVKTNNGDIRIVELFAGVGGFRVGFERASSRFKTVWNNQWEPSTKRQDASIIYQHRFGSEGHCNKDISKVLASEIPDSDMLCGGFPCQDYSVATTLVNSKGIEGKKGVLWWEIQRILRDKAEKAPKYLLLENVDRLLSSPAKQRGRDFAIILASLSDLGYYVEWRIINAADYGMPQRRKRTYIVAYHKSSRIGKQLEGAISAPYEWILRKGVISSAFQCEEKGEDYNKSHSNFTIDGSLVDVTNNFGVSEKKNAKSPFCNAGVMVNRQVWSTTVEAVYDGPRITLGDILLPEEIIPNDFFINAEELEKWKYLKGGKSEKRTTKEGFEYNYSEGAMSFPDSLEKPSRTIITGEGGLSASRFKHVVVTPTGRYRRLVPVELERLNMFPDNHTQEATDTRRAFLMGNALVTGIVENIARVLLYSM